jgi:hypothetical protein
MPRKRKKKLAHELTHDELVKRLFPKPVRRKVREITASKAKGQ